MAHGGLTRGRWLWAVIMGLAAGCISLARILLTNREALTTLVWAEDGLFPLCVRKADALSCLIDPFAGYLLAGPRLLAVPVAALPLEQWALATNVIAAIVAGAISMAAFLVVSRTRIPLPIVFLVALLPAVAPIVGFEAINVTASMYMGLLYLISLALAFPGSKPSVWWVAAGLLVTALTIPSAIVLFLPIVICAVMRLVPMRVLAIWSSALVLGLAGQFAVVFTASDRRDTSVTWDALASWVENIPDALLTWWPGLSFGGATIFGQFTLVPFALTGLVVAIALLLFAVWTLLPRSALDPGVGIALLLALLLGAIPAVTGYASNRYYVVTALLVFAALLIALGPVLARRSIVWSWVLIVVLAVVWWPAFPASPWRAGDTPNWADEVSRIRSACMDPGVMVEVHFTPDWPMPQTELSEPTTNRVLCFDLS